MEQNISFRIEGIELLEYAIIAPDKIIEPQTIFKFDINIEHRFSLENNNSPPQKNISNHVRPEKFSVTVSRSIPFSELLVYEL